MCELCHYYFVPGSGKWPKANCNCDCADIQDTNPNSKIPSWQTTIGIDANGNYTCKKCGHELEKYPEKVER